MFRAEFSRQLTGSLYLWLFGIGVVLTVASMIGSGIMALSFGPPFEEALRGTAEFVVAQAEGATLYALLFGLLYGTRDFESKFSVRQAWLSRGVLRLFAVKAAVTSALSAVLAAVVVAAAPLVAAIVFASFDKQLTLPGNVGVMLLGIFVEIVGYSLLGLAIGWLVRSTVWALVGTLVYTFVLEGLVSLWWPKIAQFSPGMAASAMNGSNVFGVLDLLPMAWAYLVFFAWIALFTGAALWRANSSDVAS